MQASAISESPARWRVLSRRRSSTKYGHGTAPRPFRDSKDSWQQSDSKNLQIPGTNRAPEIPDICLRSSALSQAHLHQPIPGCTDKAQKQHAILLQHSCRFKRAHRCVLFARQLGYFESAIFRPPPRSVKSDLWPKKAAV